MVYQKLARIVYTDLCTVAILAVIALTLCINVQGKDYFCENNQVIHIRNVTEGRVITREAETAHYANGLHCMWIIEAARDPSIDLAINVKVVHSELEWAPKGALCVSYDYVTVYDGRSSNAPTLLMWCGERNPYSLTSTGAELYIEFVANDRNQSPYSGVELAFIVFERQLTEGGCPPGWVDDPDLPAGGPSCYKLNSHRETWTMAQTYCAYDQANLVSLSSGKEELLILEMISKASFTNSDRVWLSLNDIEADGQYTWLNGDNLTFMRWADPNHRSNSYYNCITMNKEGYWQEDFCNENDIKSLVKHQFICEKNKVGNTEIYPIPAGRSTKGGTSNMHPNQLMTVIIVVGCVIVAVIVAVILVCCCKHFRANKLPIPSEATKYEVSGRHHHLTSSSVNDSADGEQQLHSMAPAAEQQPHTVVVVVQQHRLPSEPPPPYEEAAE